MNLCVGNASDAISDSGILTPVSPLNRAMLESEDWPWSLRKAEAHSLPGCGQRYTYGVLQTIQMKLVLLCVWAERAVLGSAKTALKFKYEIQIG